MPKISELPLANKLKEEDYIPIVQDGVTKKVKGTHFVTEEEYSLDAFSPTIAANDKAMYKFGEGDNVDFSESAYDGAYKSAILKGNTLVNHVEYKAHGTAFQKDDYMFTLVDSTKSTSVIEQVNGIKDQTLYTVIVEIAKNTISSNGSIRVARNSVFGSGDIYIPNGFVGVFKKTFTTNFSKATDLNGNNTIQYNTSGISSEELIIGNHMILEGDYTNVDIPYFEGMSSVKMPVLTTVGKNLFDGKIEKSSIDVTTGSITPNVASSWSATNYINVKNINSLYFQTSQLSNMNVVYMCFDENKNFIGHKGFYNSLTGIITPLNNTHYIRLRLPSDIDVSTTQIEQGTQPTSYEPYKSNILSCLEPVTLGKVGDVQDTLNVLTGEVVERTKEIVLDGTQTVSKWTGTTEKINTLTWNIDVDGMAYGSTLISDKLKVMSSPSSANSVDEEVVATSATSNKLYIRLNKSRGLTPEEVVTNLSQNPIKIQYLLKEKVHKTVDLSGTPFGYKGGHIIKSSAEGSLLPKFEYEVAVSRGAQISQNTSTLIKHDEKITELLKKTAATYINQKAEIAHLLNMSNTLEEVQTIPFIEDDYVNDDCMVDSDMVMDDMELEPEKEIIDNVDTLLINLIYDLIELNDTLDLYEKVELFRQSGLIDKHNYEIIKEKLNPSFKEEDYADINQ